MRPEIDKTPTCTDLSVQARQAMSELKPDWSAIAAETAQATKERHEEAERIAAARDRRGDIVDDINIDSWHESLAAAMTARVTEIGKFPHRAGGTVHLMNLRSLGRIIELAKLGQQVQKKHGKSGKALLAEKLRALADDVEHSED